MKERRTSTMSSKKSGRAVMTTLIDLFEAAEIGAPPAAEDSLARRSPQNEETALMVAAVLGKAGRARILVGKEAKMQDACGWTALVRAAYKGRLECVKILAPLEKGVKSNEAILPNT